MYFNALWQEDPLVLEEGHRLLFAVIRYEGGARQELVVQKRLSSDVYNIITYARIKNRLLQIGDDLKLLVEPCLILRKRFNVFLTN